MTVDWGNLVKEDRVHQSVYRINDIKEEVVKIFGQNWVYLAHEVLDVYSDQCLYWIPITPGGGDPRKEVSHAFDDRRRLEDRTFRLKTGYAHSQIPMSRTRRMLTNIEFSQGSSVNEVRIRANFILYELRTGTVRSYAGWYGYKLKRENQKWEKIDLKMVNLIDCYQGHENLTFML